MDQEKQQRNLEETKQMMLDVSEGQKSAYWGHLYRKVKRWADAESRYLDSFKRTGLDQENLVKFNMASERLGLMNQFLTLNETILKDCKGFIEQVVMPSEELTNYTPTFVGRKNEEEI